MKFDYAAKHFLDKGLMPFQVKFLSEFLRSKNKPTWMLVAPPGAGKTHLANVLLDDLITHQKLKRILIITPYVASGQLWIHLSNVVARQSPDFEVIKINRKTFLELQADTPLGRDLWPQTGVFLINLDFAKLDDVLASLVSTTWDFVMIEDGERLEGKRRKVFDLLSRSQRVKRMLILSSVFFPLNKDVEVKVIKHDDIDGWRAGQPTLLFSRLIKLIPFTRTKKEQALIREVSKLAQKLSRIGEVGALQSSNLLQAGASSLQAAESTLRRLFEYWMPIRNKTVHGLSLTTKDIEKISAEDVLDIEDESVNDQLSIIQATNLDILLENISELADKLSLNAVDSKLKAMLRHIAKGTEKSSDHAHFCICCSFSRTALIVESFLVDKEFKVYRISSAIEPLEIERTLLEYRASGGILLITDASSKGLNLDFVSECINYDVPVGQQAFFVRIIRFLGDNRTSQLKIYILKDNSDAFTWEQEQLSNLLKR